ncbi:Heat shock protein HtpX [Rhodovulum sp. PH10]|uniref:M48 family metallopeptidase n=1 Tax=Rhodovulum sp. PH10 TaxID=1187851 RepID=UPI00027C2906|nr:M48 family metallopeptidase [Rhodovulum sp. PH10]EJW11745.1 Heat shock protein HtpX [Rhodovulum sp. PH10]
MAYGLYTHIRANRRRTVALLIGLFAQVYVLVYAGALAGEALTVDADLAWLMAQAWRDFLQALPWATAGTAVWIAIAYRFHQTMIDAVTGGRTVTRTDVPRLWNLLENLCISRGITMPRLTVMESDALNAFATGLNEKQYAVTVTTGLLSRLDDAEIEAVLGHELTHIRNGDVRLMVIATVVAGVIGFFAELLFRVGLRGGIGWGGGRSRQSGGGDDGGRGRGGGGGAVVAILIAVALVALAWALSQTIRFALSRSREFLADAGSVELTKNPDAMISALRKIEGRGELPGATSAVMEMCVDNPRSGFADLFATHPPIEVRIDALVKFAGGRDPGPIAFPPQEGAGASASGAPAGEVGAGEAGPWGAPSPAGGPPPLDVPPEVPSDLPPESPPASSPAPWGPRPPPDPPVGPSSGPPLPPTAAPPAGPWGPRR